MKLSEAAAVIEAILFAGGDPVEPDRLAGAAGIDKGALPELTEQLNEYYRENGSSLTVIRLSGSYQLTASPRYYDNIKAALETKKNTPLSPAAMEVLTIIAYNQPVTKGFVEHVRGVDSSSIVNSLAEKDLLEEAGRLDVPGRPIAYRTTDTFLRCFNLESLDDLPELPENKKADFEAALVDEDAAEEKDVTEMASYETPDTIAEDYAESEE